MKMKNILLILAIFGNITACVSSDKNSGSEDNAKKQIIEKAKAEAKKRLGQRLREKKQQQRLREKKQQQRLKKAPRKK